MLLEAERGFSPQNILDLIVAGLPPHIQKSLNPSSIINVEKLHSKIKKYETNEKEEPKRPSIVSNNFSNKKEAGNSESKTFTRNISNFNRPKPCSICAKQGRPSMHKESQCWFKETEKTKKESNNTEMPSIPLPDEDQKN